ncbi:MAG TPA: 50S ribosomal protein L1 [Myxococcales bacterium LLY-WYZ-16_1]|nr:50S ribosomal protein L1 [Myxococcales bacterium LLY-WYZ-16_1]
MKKRGKKYREKAKLVDASRRYTVDEACELVGQTKVANFDETVEVAVKLGVDPRHADQMIRGAVVLPAGTGKTKRVAVFCRGEKQQAAKDAGADVVGAEDLVERVQGGFLDFDVVVASPDMMALVGRLGRVLGPRGLMPNPKTGTVTPNVAQAVSDSKGGKIEYRTEKAGVVHAPIGKSSFEPAQLKQNLVTVIDALNRAKPASAKGVYMQSVTISTTMGPGIAVEPSNAA